MIDFDEAVEYFKLIEARSVHRAVVLVGQPETQRVLAIYSSMPVTVVRFEHEDDEKMWDDLDFSDPGSIPEQQSRKLWDWLWTQVKISFEEYSERVMMPADDVERRFQVLQAARMVFPDGTISPVGANILRATVARSFPSPKVAPVPKEKKVTTGGD